MDKLVKKEASPLQRESQQTHIIHENFGFATTYHEKVGGKNITPPSTRRGTQWYACHGNHLHGHGQTTKELVRAADEANWDGGERMTEKKDHGIVAFFKSGARYYREHPLDGGALIISIIALIVAFAK